jgi:hypothetical protein
MTKRNIPMMVDPEFENMVKQIQVNIRIKVGENISLREITKRLSNLPELKHVEDRLLAQNSLNNNLIKFDKRKWV